MIDDSEMVDCAKAIEAHGFELNDFEFIPRQDPPGKEEIHAITGKVTVKRSSNGAEKSYSAGHGTAWTVEFSDDLSNGIFGDAI